ncbi:hypothetical protein QR680_017116 [Steinernema hermaphroditum]|uniref:GP-PDE domain-containing protein n=1 Tax=Steinernema hermaphroditum TaxID=289476 RepID=A0AA39HDD5_9BILA|nr:hypothetical protein QR680_017116 [Steinernema hermaphroditum]
MAGDAASLKLVKVCFAVNPPAEQAIRPWECFFVVGNSSKLGNWDPDGALELTRRSSTDPSSEWVGSITGTTLEFNEPLRFRYFTGYYLESAKKFRIISRWESWVSPRTVIPTIEASSSSVCREHVIDEFGTNGGRQQLSEGWLQNAEHNEILLRIHGDALKFYSTRHAQRTYRIHVSPFDLQRREDFNYDANSRFPLTWHLASLFLSSSHDDEDSQSGSGLPKLPSFSHTDVAILSNSDPTFHDQHHYGEIFQNNNSYFVFRTHTVAFEFLAFRIEFFTDSTLEVSCAKSSHVMKESTRLPERVAVAYCLPSSMQHSFGKVVVPVLGRQQKPIGQITMDYLLVKGLTGLTEPLKMDVSFCHHWKKRRTLEVGHRGSGNSYTKFAAARENTIHSLNNAAQNGADFVEFDVQLTKDRTAVIFHDFHVLVSVAKRSSSLLLEPGKPYVPAVVELHQMAIKDLKLNQLHLLHLDHYQHDSPDNCRKGSVKVSAEDHEGVEHRPFPTLIEAFMNINPETGFNIEVKYPMMMKNGCHECENYFERNEYIDVILSDVLNHAGSRRIVFSSFDPDICTLISLKQNRYPVLFLCVGATTRYVPFLDERSSTSMTAVNFAAGTQLLGVNFHSEDLLRDAAPLHRANKLGLVSFVWGDDLDSQKNIEYFKDLLVDGLIYDRIGEVSKRQNVFTVEREAKNALFKNKTPAPSLSPSRSSSIDGGAGVPQGTPLRPPSPLRSFES